MSQIAWTGSAVVITANGYTSGDLYYWWQTAGHGCLEPGNRGDWAVGPPVNRVDG